MKKYLLVVLCALLLVVVTGCGNKNQVVCSQDITESGMTMKAEVIADVDADSKITGASIVVDFGSNDLANSYCELYKQYGDDSKISCSGSKVTFEGTTSLDDDDDNSAIGMTKEDFIKKAEAEGYTCK